MTNETNTLFHEENVRIINDNLDYLTCDVTVDGLECELWNDGYVYIDDKYIVVSVETLDEICTLAKMFRDGWIRNRSKKAKV